MGLGPQHECWDGSYVCDLSDCPPDPWEDEIYGCTDPTCSNYNEDANMNDGSCIDCFEDTPDFYDAACGGTCNIASATIQCNTGCWCQETIYPHGQCTRKRRNVTYQEGGNVNNNNRFSGRTQTNSKGKFKK